MMKIKSSIQTMVLVATVVMFTFTGVARAATEDAQHSMLAIVNLNKIMNDSDAAKDFKKKMEAKRKELQKELAAKEKQLHDEQSELIKQKSTVSEDVFKEKLKAFDQKVLSLRRLSDKHRFTLEYGTMSSIEKIKVKATQIIDQLVKKHKIALVLNQQSVVQASASLDITNEVIAALNQDMKKVSIDWEPPKKK